MLYARVRRSPAAADDRNVYKDSGEEEEEGEGERYTRVCIYIYIYVSVENCGLTRLFVRPPGPSASGS